MGMTIDEAITRYKNNAEYERIHGNLQGCLEFRQLAEWLKDYKRLLEQESKTEWIPVSERLPEEGKIVIASVKGSVYPEARYVKGYGWEWAYESGADYWEELEDVIAWCELPKPYSEVEQ